MRVLGRTGRIDDADLDVAHAVDLANGLPGLAHQRGGILAREQEGEGDPVVLAHGEIAHHAGGEEIGAQARILDARERGDDGGFDGHGFRG